MAPTEEVISKLSLLTLTPEAQWTGEMFRHRDKLLGPLACGKQAQLSVEEKQEAGRYSELLIPASPSQGHDVVVVDIMD